MKRGGFITGAVLCLAFLPFTASGEEKGPAAGEKWLSKSCMGCHKEYQTQKDIIAGEVHTLSNKAKTLQIKVNEDMQLVKFTDGIPVQNVESLKDLKSPMPVRVHFKKVGDDLVATKIVAKPKIGVPPEQIIPTPEMVKLVAQGPEKGNFLLVDSRPGIKFDEGHIPGAVSIPFPKMNEMQDRFPADKGKRIVFYCGGLR
jgi:hypothetical protein